jgi:hypothetical protein
MSQLREVFSSQGPASHFFGYYDKSPLDKTGRRLLALRCDLERAQPQAGDQAAVGYFDIETKAYHQLDSSRAFNWQQGAMLQWLGPDFHRRVIFNDLRQGQVVAVLLDLTSGERRLLPGGVTSVAPSGRQAVALDWRYLAQTRPSYSYAGLAADDPLPPEDNALWRLDLDSGARHRLIGLAELLSHQRLSSMAGARHSLEHPMVSPDGRRFCFYHRWVLADGGVFTRLYSLSMAGEDLRLLLDSGKVTHACWRGNDQVVLWGGLPSLATGLRRHRLLVKTLLKPLLPFYRRLVRHRPGLQRAAAGVSYLRLRDSDSPAPRRLADGLLTRDGHPSFHPHNRDLLLTDSYPDEKLEQQLYLYDLAADRLESLGGFKTLASHRETAWRCDLHPRWDFSGRMICVDSLHSGQRQIHLYRLVTDGA